MPNQKAIPATMSHRALEMVMRGVLENMSEISLEAGFSPTDGGFEIIEIVPERPAPRPMRKAETERANEEITADVLDFPNLLRAVG